MSVETFRKYGKRLAPFALGLGVLASVGVGVAAWHARACCVPGAPCCHLGAGCCHGAHAPKV